ncbi:MAG: protein kinase, partial [Acidobacteria bacterium Pan2503]|nr:protein kinase [Candidatus Acidoferrum panamensis]
EREAAHLQIGRTLASQTEPAAIEENLFEIVNQLDRGAALIDSTQERDGAAELNLLAARRAKASTAYSSSMAYLSAGRALLGADSWERQYALTLAFELELAECEFLTGLLAEAEARLSTLDARVRNLVDRAAVTQLRVTICAALDLHQRGIELSLEYLRRIGIDWSPHPSRVEVEQEYDRIWQRLGSRPIEALIDLPIMTDPEQRATLDALTPALPAAVFTDENLNCLLLCRMVNLSLEHGNCAASCFAYAMFARVLGPYFGDAAAGFRFGKLAFDLIERPGLGRYKARVTSVFAFLVNPWAKHISTSQALGRRAFDIAQETGDLTFAAYCAACSITILLGSGTPLDEVQVEAEKGLEFARRAKFGVVVDFVVGTLMAIRSLRGLTLDFRSFDDAEFDEVRFERHFEA